MYARLGRWSFRNRWRVIILWIGLIVTANVVGNGIVGAAYDSSFDIPASESSDGFEVLDEYFGGQGTGFTGSIVFRADAGVDDPGVQAAMSEIFAETAEIDGVFVTSPYDERGAQQVARQGELAGQIAYASLDLDPEIDQVEAGEVGHEIQDIIDGAVAADPSLAGVQIEIGGANLSEFEPPETELIGLAFAVVILIVSFGSVLAMGLPIGVAVAGVVTGVAVTALLSNLTTVPDFATLIGAMIGLGVGIDYALFIVTRYRELRRAGHANEDAVAYAMDTAGRAVVFAGATVVVSLFGLLLIGLPFVAGLGIGAAITVLLVMVGSITLLPALLGLAGDRIEVTRWRGLVAAGFVALGLLGVGLGVPPLFVAGAVLAFFTILASFAVSPLRNEVPARRERPLRETFAYRWSRVVQRHPWAGVGIGAGILLVFTAPVLALNLGWSDEGNFTTDTTTRRAYDLLSDGFGPGFNGPFVITVTDQAGGALDVAAVQGVAAALGSADGVASVSPPFPNDPAAPQAALIQLIPTTSPQDTDTEDLVERLREDVIPVATAGTDLEVLVTGFVPSGIDFTEYLSGRIILFFGVVLALSFFLLMAVFRSILVPLKAVIMNGLSISAAYGIVVAIFQWGWLADVVGIGGGAPIEPFIPMMMFAIVFGLSMDYEVFLLSRVKEEYERTGDPVNSVADGLAATARVITAAAAIMVVVFGSFMLEDDRIIKLFGVGLASAVLLDATLVRMLLVPATMELLGARNWWLPAWLDRLIPNLNVEGTMPEAVNGADRSTEEVAADGAETKEPVGAPGGA